MKFCSHSIEFKSPSVSFNLILSFLFSSRIVYLVSPIRHSQIEAISEIIILDIDVGKEKHCSTFGCSHLKDRNFYMLL